MHNVVAIIDLGTNTFHLLIARIGSDGYEILHRQRAPVKIGLGSMNRNRIGEEGANRAVTALQDFVLTMSQFGVRQTYAFATSAFRSATNGAAVVERIGTETGVRVEIIPGEKEAGFIYYGIRSAIDLGKEPSLVMDIGGGSVEYILCNADQIQWKRSYDIGAQRLLERFGKHDPILMDERRFLQAHLDEQLDNLSAAIRTYGPVTMVGSSGTFDTLSEIHCHRNRIPYDEHQAESPLSFDSFNNIYKELLIKDRAQRLAIPGMVEVRVDMIVVACCLIDWVLRKHSFHAIRVSSSSLKEGVLYCLTHGKGGNKGVRV